MPSVPKRPRLSTSDFVEGVRANDRVALARAITLIESHRPDHRVQAQEVLAALLPDTGKAHRIGITGVPGVGKSNFIEALGLHLVAQGHRVAVLAIDPTSVTRGGSILGDKTRMNRLATHPMAFIRPSPTKGNLGGVHRKTRETMLLCEAAGFDIILVETVGVGQSEVAVASMVDTSLVLMLAGAGDELQGIKKGILEVADILAINKADGDNEIPARRAKQAYIRALQLVRHPKEGEWSPEVLTCSGLHGQGIDEVWGSLQAHRNHGMKSGQLEARRQSQRLQWMWAMIEHRLLQAFKEHPEITKGIAATEAAVLQGTLPPTLAAQQLLNAAKEG